MGLLQERLTAEVAGFVSELGLPESLAQVQLSRRPDLGQFQVTGALKIAKELKRAPLEIAEQLAAALAESPAFARVSACNPGFVNFDADDRWLAAWLNGVLADERLGCPKVADPQRVILDFGGPNVAKPMHVGHLRSSIIGDSLQRTFRFAGHHVVGDIHLGDWGLPMGMLITEVQLHMPELPYFDAAFTGPYPAESPLTMDQMQEWYPAAANRCKGDIADMERARVATAELQQGRPGYIALWQHFVAVTHESLRQDWNLLDVSFDLWWGESTVHDMVEPLIAKMQAAGFAEESQGAVIIDVAEESDKKPMPPLMLKKSDEGITYAATDLATIEKRVADLDPQRCLYVVDQRQHLHFEQVFRAAHKAQLSPGVELKHIGFGTVNGPDGKPFRTRAGGVMRLADLLQTAVDKAEAELRAAKLGEGLSDAEKAAIARQIGVGAIRFADLVQNRTSDYIFDMDRFVRFQGKTGPYVQYAAVRVSSLIRKATAAGMVAGAILPASHDSERQLMLQQALLPEALEEAIDTLMPSALALWAFELAQRFHTFYHDCPVLRADTPEIAASRLALSQLTLAELDLVLGLLGMERPDSM